MNYKEILARITGISVPVFGVSWNPPEPQSRVARRVLAFLEDRRLFNLRRGYHSEVEEQCVASALEVRKFLTEAIGELDSDTELAKRLRAIRQACRKFLDSVGSPARHFRSDPPDTRFFTALGELRSAVALNVGAIAVMFGLDVEGELADALPQLDDSYEP